MKPRPLHRSVIFWSGIFVMLSIVWLWWDSERHVTRLDSGIWMLDQNQSAVMLLCTGKVRTRTPGIHRDPIARHFAPKLFPAPLIMRSRGVPVSYRDIRAQEHKYYTMREDLIWDWTHLAAGSLIIYLPHWLILTTFALPWAGLLIWRSRRARTVGS